MMKTILEVRELKKHIGKTEILHDISFSIYENEIVGFVGPNGAGKSTTMKCITGLYKVKKGNVFIMEHDIYDHHVEALKFIGASIESPALFPDLNGIDHFKIVSNWRKENKNNLQELYQFCGLSEKELKRPVRTYSMGMKQRLMLSLTLIGSPKLLLLDEPMNGLDPQATFEFREKLLELKKKNTSIFLSSHQLNEIEKVCDRIIFIKEGKILDSVSTTILQQIQYYKFKVTPMKKAFDICNQMNLEAKNSNDDLLIRFDSSSSFNNFLKTLIDEHIEILDINKEVDRLEHYYKTLYKK